MPKMEILNILETARIYWVNFKKFKQIIYTIWKDCDAFSH